ncbi:hypothetical protein GCM10010512_36400 [Streptomyces thermoviolaceus subsp. thermoviolaceus]|jgi:hypothetical protein|nr:hypothetical protein GCM10010499_38450 [Streptomyces thermoviolaceus subsp. apingens]GHB01578.1 hypothetical protein GCM10010512_36400 [Streptomyces thermoviolaceus subsp. thermoviolaceus]
MGGFVGQFGTPAGQDGPGQDGPGQDAIDNGTADGTRDTMADEPLPELVELIAAIRRCMAELSWSYHVLGRKTNASSSTWNRWCTQTRLPRRDALVSFAEAAPEVVGRHRLLALWDAALAAQESARRTETSARKTEMSAGEPKTAARHTETAAPHTETGTRHTETSAPSTETGARHTEMSARETTARSTDPRAASPSAAQTAPAPPQPSSPPPATQAVPAAAATPAVPAAAAAPSAPAGRHFSLGSLLLGAAGVLALGAGLTVWIMSANADDTTGAPPAAPPTTTAAPITVQPSPTISCHGTTCAGLDPARTHCADDAVTAYSGQKYGATIELRHSPSCGTVWAKMSRTFAGDRVTVTHRDGHSEEYRQQYGRDAHTLMLVVDSPEDAKACAIIQDRGTFCATHRGPVTPAAVAATSS